MLKNITFSADEELIRAARQRAMTQNTTLNELFREWLAEVAGQGEGDKDRIRSEYDALMERLGRVDAGRAFTREEMNERR